MEGKSFTDASFKSFSKFGRRGSSVKTDHSALKASVFLSRVKRSSSLEEARPIFQHAPVEIKHHFAVHNN